MENLNYLPPREAMTKVKEEFPQLNVDAVHTFLEFLWIADEVLHSLDNHFASYGISRGKFSVLMMLYRFKDEGRSPHELAEMASVTRGTITGLLDGLEKSGYVLREKHFKDRRMLIIRLTKSGIDLLEDILPDHFRRVSTMMETLNKKERTEILNLLKKIQDGTSSLRK